jgi:hypothetical protein
MVDLKILSLLPIH